MERKYLRKRLFFQLDCRGGFTLPAAMALSILLSMLLLSLNFMGAGEGRAVLKNEQSLKAFWLAESAIAKFRFDYNKNLINSDRNYSGKDFNGLSGTMSYTWKEATKTLIATGDYNGEVQHLKISSAGTPILDFAYYDTGLNKISPAGSTFTGVGIMPFNNLDLTGSVYAGTDVHIGTTNPDAKIQIAKQGAKKELITTGKVILDKSPFYFNFAGKVNVETITLVDQGALKGVSSFEIVGDRSFAGYKFKVYQTPYTTPTSMDIAAGGYYDQEADSKGKNLDTNFSSYSEPTFFNQAYQKSVTVRELDIGADLSGNWPGNGLLYSRKPILIKNAASLDNALMIVADADIYVKGDFNTNGIQSAVLMTNRRIIYLSDAWIHKTGSGVDYSTDHLAGPGIGYRMEVHAARIDGVRFICSNNWVTDDNWTPTNPYDDKYLAPGGSGDVFDATNKFTPPKGQSNPCGGALLEDWNYDVDNDGTSDLLTLVLKGPIVHLRTASMNRSDLTNAGNDDNDMYWTIERSYNPPKRLIEFESIHQCNNCLFKDYIPNTYQWQFVQ